MEIIPSLPSDEDNLVAMFAEYGFALQKKSWWDWKYRNNPHGQAKSFKMMQDGKMVGAVAVMPQLFTFEEKEVVGIQTVDGLMGREIRGKHLFNDVMAFLLENRPDGIDGDSFYLSFPSLASSVRAHENAGWVRLADGLVFKFPLKVESLERSPRLYRFRKLLSPAFSLFRRLLVSQASSRFKIAEITCFEASMIPDLKTNLVRGVRSPEMLNWRVFENCRDSMRAFTINEDEKVLGYFVCKQEKGNMEIVEARISNPSPKHLLAMLRYIIQEDLASSVDLLMFGIQDNMALLPRFGFLRLRFSGAVFVSDVRLASLPADPRKWEISYLDSDW
jgi:hypothetical protein